MPKRITINIGFITNSSSVVHWFPRQVLDDPDVQAFLRAYEIEDGYVGSDLWARNQCGSFVVTKEQRLEMNEKMVLDWGDGQDTHGPKADVDSDDVLVVYGDEHHEISLILSGILARACKRLGITPGGSASYN